MGKIDLKDIGIIIGIFFILAIIEFVIVIFHALVTPIIPAVGQGIPVTWVFILQIMVAILTWAVFFKKK